MNSFVFISMLVFTSVAMLIYCAVPAFLDKTITLNQRRSQRFSTKVDRILMREDAQRMSRVYVLAPITMGAMGFMFFPEEFRLLGIIIGIIGGFFIPSLYLKVLIQKRKRRFSDQLTDALMIMSSSLRGGLSLVQSLEAVVEEMPDPINQEFGIVLGENKMGVSLEDALNHMYERMASPALQQVITAILLARETGGNLPVIFSRIVATIREHRKIEQSIRTLSIQGKIQGVVMSLLPVGFGFVIYSSNPRFFDTMVYTQLGRSLLTYAIISEIIGAFLIYRISTFKNF